LISPFSLLVTGRADELLDTDNPEDIKVASISLAGLDAAVENIYYGGGGNDEVRY
jgi:hypothetical protein